jgi:NTP pyrophosphatase (non-canonical NTP hydrolase)
MGTYIPVPTRTKVCKNCKSEYESRDKRQKYCSSSCNVLACRKRKDYKSAFALPSRSSTKKTVKDFARDAGAAAIGTGVALGVIELGKKLTNYESPELKLLKEIKENPNGVNEEVLKELADVLTAMYQDIMLLNQNMMTFGNTIEQKVTAIEEKLEDKKPLPPSRMMLL